MKTINIKRSNEILMTFIVEEGSSVMLCDLVSSHIQEICKKKFPSYDESVHSVSYWFNNKFIGDSYTYVITFNDEIKFVCDENFDFDMGMVISSKTSPNSTPLYFMNNLN